MNAFFLKGVLESPPRWVTRNPPVLAIRLVRFRWSRDPDQKPDEKSKAIPDIFTLLARGKVAKLIKMTSRRTQDVLFQGHLETDDKGRILFVVDWSHHLPTHREYVTPNTVKATSRRRTIEPEDLALEDLFEEDGRIKSLENPEKESL